MEGCSRNLAIIHKIPYFSWYFSWQNKLISPYYTRVFLAHSSHQVCQKKNSWSSTTQSFKKLFKDIWPLSLKESRLLNHIVLYFTKIKENSIRYKPSINFTLKLATTNCQHKGEVCYNSRAKEAGCGSRVLHHCTLQSSWKSWLTSIRLDFTTMM